MIRVPVESKITAYLHAKAAKIGQPLNGTFEVTPCCNMSCKMCYVRKSKEEQEAISPLLSAAEWLQVGKQAKEKGLLYLLLTGGEPFLRPDFREILAGLHRMGFIITINSNGTLIDEDVVTWLKETPPAAVNITLYGASDKTYDRLCGNPEGFTQAMRAIHLLREAGIFVKLKYSSTPDNVNDMEEIFLFAKREGLFIQATSYMFPPIRRDESQVGENLRFSPEEAAYQNARIAAFVNGEEAFLESMKNNVPLSLLANTEEDCPEIEGQGEGIHCRAGKCSFWITWDGKMLPCGMFPSSHGFSVRQCGFARAWDKVLESAKEIRLPAKCGACILQEQCKACAAVVLTETGNYHTVPQYRCQMSQAYSAACRRLEQEILNKKG